MTRQHSVPLTYLVAVLFPEMLGISDPNETAQAQQLSQNPSTAVYLTSEPLDKDRS